MREETFITEGEEKEALASPIQVNRAAESFFDRRLTSRSTCEEPWSWHGRKRFTVRV
jgi:hypothetical protein